MTLLPEKYKKKIKSMSFDPGILLRRKLRKDLKTNSINQMKFIVNFSDEEILSDLKLFENGSDLAITDYDKISKAYKKKPLKYSKSLEAASKLKYMTYYLEYNELKALIIPYLSKYFNGEKLFLDFSKKTLYIEEIEEKIISSLSDKGLNELSNKIIRDISDAQEYLLYFYGIIYKE